MIRIHWVPSSVITHVGDRTRPTKHHDGYALGQRADSI